MALIDDLLARTVLQDNENSRTILENLIKAEGFDALNDDQIVLLVEITNRFNNSLVFSFTQERLDQKQLFTQAKNYYMNRSDLHREEIIDGVFSDDDNQTDASGNQVSVNTNTPKSQTKAVFEIIGFTRDVVEELAVMYSPEPPQRIFFKNEDGELSDEEEANLQFIYDKIGNDKFQRINQLTKATDVILVRVAWRNDEEPDREKKRIWLDIKTPDQYDIVTSKLDDSVAEMIFFETRSYDTIQFQKNKHTIYELWHPLFVVIYRVNFVYNPNESSTITPGMIEPMKIIPNPYQMLPFVKVTNNEIYTDYFSDENARRFVNNENQLTLKKLSANILNLNSGFAQPVLKTFRNPKLANFKLGSNNVLILQKGNSQESDDEFDYISPNAQIDPINKDFKDSYISAADRFGASSQGGESSSSASGVSLFISDDKKNKIINKDRPRYATFEERLFETIRVVANHEINNPQETTDKTDIKPIPDEIRLKADFKEVVTKLNNNEQIAQDQFDLDNDLADRVKIIMERNPDLTEEQAIKIVQQMDKRRIQLDQDAVEIEDGDEIVPED